MRDYLFDSIWINGREIPLHEIITHTTEPLTDFEDGTFRFISEWFSGKSSFHIQTSGSTGSPKEIQITRQQMIASAKLTEHALQLKPGMIALTCLDTRYIAGKMMLTRCFVTGMKIIVIDPVANPFEKIPSSLDFDFVALVPYQVYEILDSDFTRRLNSIQTVIIGGASLRDTAEQELKRYSCQSYITYGMTETISHIALHHIGKCAENCFTVLPEINISQDYRGCLIIEANHLSERIKTNDIVELIDTRTFKWVGRWDNVINSGGVKIHSEKVEAQIEKIFARLNIHNRFFIAGLPDKKLGEHVVLIIENSLEESLKERLKIESESILSRFEMPKFMHFIPEFHTTKTGKIDRNYTLSNIKDSEIF
ncbi:MAG: AMP-binding protein [Cyclobacteriaceae bacterium]|nr:AMP-binding protein [Cyclobacteriaceae bacterium]